ncbi:MAG TPA: hypothetical protein VIG49_16045, partial [Acetobacteraceae bacterium]
PFPMADKHNFILVPDDEPPSDGPGGKAVTLFGRLRSLAASVASALPNRSLVTDDADEAAGADGTAPRRPRLIFGFDATASREPAWATARKVTDALVRALPGELDVALAVHGGSRLHTFTPFTADPNTLRDRAAGIACIAGHTQLLPILSRALAAPGVRVVTYIGDVYEESPARGRKIADELGHRGIRLIVLHDVADWNARRDAELFLDLARRTGGCVLPFDANAPDRLREMLAAIAVLAVGGTELLHERRGELPGAVMLLEHLGHGR